MGRSYQQTAIWLTHNREDLAASQQLLPAMPAMQNPDKWAQHIACWSSQENQAIVNPPCEAPMEVGPDKFSE